MKETVFFKYLISFFIKSGIIIILYFLNNSNYIFSIIEFSDIFSIKKNKIKFLYLKFLKNTYEIIYSIIK